MRYPISFVAELVDLAREDGVTAEQCLESSGIPEGILREPGVEVDSRQLLRVVRRCVKLLNRSSGLGLKVGSAWGRHYHELVCDFVRMLGTPSGRRPAAGAPLRTAQLGVYGYAQMSAGTLGLRGELALDYARSKGFFPGQLQTREVDGEFLLVVDDECIPEDVREFYVDVSMAWSVLSMREVLPGERMTRVEYRRPEPDDAERFHQFLDCPVFFGRKDNLMVLDAALLHVSLPRTPRFYSKAGATGPGISVSDRVLELLLNAADEFPREPDVGRKLAMSPRTLRRQLETEGTCFRQLVDEARERLAEDLLASTDVTLDQIAALLGYADSASFFRAFKRWKGMPPGAYRAQRGYGRADRTARFR